MSCGSTRVCVDPGKTCLPRFCIDDCVATPAQLRYNPGSFNPYVPAVPPVLEPILPLVCGVTSSYSGVQITGRTVSLYRTESTIESSLYYARRFSFRVDTAGEQTITVTNSDVATYVVVHRSTTHVWRHEGNDFTFTVSAEQTGPMTLEVTTVGTHQTGMFDVEITCARMPWIYYKFDAPVFLHPAIDVPPFDYYETGDITFVDSGSSTIPGIAFASTPILLLPPTMEAGKIGNVPNFNGQFSTRFEDNGSYGKINELDPTGFTIRFWLKVIASAPHNGWLSPGSSGGTGYFSFDHNVTNPEDVRFRVVGNDFVNRSVLSDAFLINVWHHIVAWVELDPALGYVKEIGLSVNNTTPKILTLTVVDDVHLDFGNGLAFSQGLTLELIDELAIWKGVLTSDERTADWNGGAGVTFPP